MIIIKNKCDCTGCGACAQICPKACIQMQKDVEGFNYPKVDASKCINCSQCIKVCPILKENQNIKSPIFCYAAKRNDISLRLKASSGGLFSVLAEYILSQGGIVFGASFTSIWSVTHKKAENLLELQDLIGTKYIQSEIGETYKEVRKYLLEDKLVLFSGTPCQIAGLHSFLRKGYCNLYTVDLICHGVPSYKVFYKFLEEKLTLKDLKNINFRDKKEGWTKYHLVLQQKVNNKITELRYNPYENIYMRYFISNLYIRPSCYKCKFKYNRSGSDITLGDFWGIEQIDLDFYDEQGVSAVLINTIKGKKLFEDVRQDITTKPVSYQDILLKNKSLEESAPMHIWRDYFFRKLEKFSFSHLIKVIERPTLKMRIIRKIKNIFLC